MTAALHIIYFYRYNLFDETVSIKSQSLEDALTTLEERDVLPAFSYDLTEVFLSSLIERNGDDDHSMIVTTFLLSHYMLESTQLSKWDTLVDPTKHIKEWKSLFINETLKPTRYHSNGQRFESESDIFYCRLRNSYDRMPYTTEGIFMPNRLAKDSNMNRRMDILRCLMEGTDIAYDTLARSSSESVYVDIIRGGHVLISFSIPWDTRRTGFLLSSPALASRFDAWATKKNLFICSPGFEYDYQTRMTRGVRPGE